MATHAKSPIVKSTNQNSPLNSINYHNSNNYCHLAVSYWSSRGHCHCTLLDAFKCNWKELTTKSAHVAIGQGLVGRRMRSSCYNVLVVFCHASVRSGVVCSICFGVSPPIPPFFVFVIFSFLLISQCDGCLPLRFPGVGAHSWVGCCASHGGVIQSRGWLPKVEAPGYPRRRDGTKRGPPNWTPFWRRDRVGGGGPEGGPRFVPSPRHPTSTKWADVKCLMRSSVGFFFK